MPKPVSPTELPKADALKAVEDTLKQLQAFIELNEAYRHHGAEHIPAVLDCLAFARNNQYLARRVD